MMVNWPWIWLYLWQGIDIIPNWKPNGKFGTNFLEIQSFVKKTKEVFEAKIDVIPV